MTLSLLLKAGHVCGDNIDLVDGQPTGSVRVSFGYMSTFEDCQNFLNFVVDCFVEKPVKVDQVRLERLKRATPSQSSNKNLPTKMTDGRHNLVDERHDPIEQLSNGYGGKAIAKHASNCGKAYTLTNIYIYPIKSCGAFEV